MNKSGFTLFELTIALALTGIVLTMAGSGLAAILRFNQQSTVAHHSRSELQRAMDFMATEIRMADRISPCPESHPPEFSPASHSVQPQAILALSMPSSSGLTQPIVYYVAEPPPSSVWTGPVVLYRWGPTLRLNGNYSVEPAGAPVRYYNEVVVDQLATTGAAIPCMEPHAYQTPRFSPPRGFAICSDATGRSIRLSLQRHSNAAQKAIALQTVVSRRAQAIAAEPAICPLP